MHDTLRFWLDRGVDGFRMDVVQSLLKRADFADLDDPNEILYGDAHLDTTDHPRAAARHPPAARRLRRRPGVGGGDLVAVHREDGGLLRPRRRAAPVLQLPPDPGPVGCRTGGAGASSRTYEVLDPIGAWPTWVLSNHDVPRHRTRYGGSEAAARAAAVMALTLRGTPFLYEGEELGLLDAVIPPERKLDPIDRDGCRAPVPWTRDAPHGWGAEPWLPFPPESVGAVGGGRAGRPDVGAAPLPPPAGRAEALTRPAARRDRPAGRRARRRVIAWDRQQGDDRRRVVVSFATEPVEVAPDVVGAGGVLAGGGGQRRGRGGPTPSPVASSPTQAVVLVPGRH